VSTVLAARGIGSTICPWDGPGDSADAVTLSYIDALCALGMAGVDGYLSIKAPSIAYSPELMRQVLDAARAPGIRVHFDSLAPETADDTWILIRAAAASYPRIGCTLPARWRRSLADADEAAALGVSVRIVKGQWPDVRPPGVDERFGLLALAHRLAGRAVHVAVATHDHALAREALTYLHRAGTPCELELLFGLPVRRQLEVARALGIHVRMYVPYGRAWVPYSLSQVRANPRVLWWAAKDWVFGGMHDRAIRQTF
jgi:proline dehydrogenase